MSVQVNILSCKNRLMPVVPEVGFAVDGRAQLRGRARLLSVPFER